MTFLSQMGSPSSPPPHRPFWKVMLLLDCLSCQKTQLLSAWICCFSSWNKINKRKKPKSFKPSKWECFLFAPLSSLGHITDDIFLHSCIRWAYKDRRGILKPASVAYGCIDKREIGLDKLGQCFKKQRHRFANKGPYRQRSGFSSHQVWMWELDHQEGWAPFAWPSEHWASWLTKQQQLFELTPLSLLRLHLSLTFHHRTATLHWTSVHGALWILYCLCEKYLGFWTCRVPGTFRGHEFDLIFKICHCGEVTARMTELKNKPGFHGCQTLSRLSHATSYVACFLKGSSSWNRN